MSDPFGIEKAWAGSSTQSKTMSVVMQGGRLKARAGAKAAGKGRNLNESLIGSLDQIKGNRLKAINPGNQPDFAAEVGSITKPHNKKRVTGNTTNGVDFRAQSTGKRQLDEDPFKLQYSGKQRKPWRA